jgi:hypothetical protein
MRPKSDFQEVLYSCTTAELAQLWNLATFGIKVSVFEAGSAGRIVS